MIIISIYSNIPSNDQEMVEIQMKLILRFIQLKIGIKIKILNNMQFMI